MSAKPKKTRSPTKRRETKRHRDAFEAWYAADRSCRKISENIGVPESTLFDWLEWFDWHQKADKRDAEAQKIADKKAIKERAKRLEEQRKAGTLLRARGMQAFSREDFEFSNTGDAIRAIKTGIDIERQADGLPNWIFEILNADEDTLIRLESSLPDGEEAGAIDDIDEARV